MAGLVAQAEQDIALSTTTIAAGAEVLLKTITVDNAVCADLWIEGTAASSDSLEIYLKKRGNTYAGENKYLVLSIEASQKKALWFPLEAGTYEIWAKNNDTGNAASVTSPAKLVTYVWQ